MWGGAVSGDSREENETERRSQGVRMVYWFTRLLWRERPLAVAVNVSLMAVQGLLPAAQLLILQQLLDAVDRTSGAGGGVSDILLWIVALAAIRAGIAGIQALRAVSRAYLRESA